jgi:hypothetical protein
MKENGHPTKSLAEEASIPEGTLKTWLAGSELCSLLDVRKVATSFGASFEYLLFGDEKSIEEMNPKKKTLEIFRRRKIEVLNKEGQQLRTLKPALLPLWIKILIDTEF